MKWFLLVFTAAVMIGVGILCLQLRDLDLDELPVPAGWKQWTIPPNIPFSLPEEFRESDDSEAEKWNAGGLGLWAKYYFSLDRKTPLSFRIQSFPMPSSETAREAVLDFAKTRGSRIVKNSSLFTARHTSDKSGQLLFDQWAVAFDEHYIVVTMGVEKDKIEPAQATQAANETLPTIIGRIGKKRG